MTALPTGSTVSLLKIRDHSAVQTLTSIIQNRSILVLATTGTLTGLVYWLMFVQPHTLVALQRRSLLDLYDLVKIDSLARWRLLGGFLIQGVLYWVGWRAARHAQGRTAWIIVLIGTLASCTILLFLYPYDAADVFDNIMHGRILGVYGANPFERLASDFKADPFYRYTAWRYDTSAYGPGWEILAGGAARLAGDAVITNVLVFKLLAGAFLWASIAVVAAVLRRMAPERALAGIVLLAWNPVILYETFGHGHNDMAMVFWILLAILTLLHRRYVLTVLVLVTGALVKFIPLLMLPTATLIALRDLSHARARVRFAFLSFGVALLLVILVYAPFWHGKDTLDIERRQELFTTSLPAFSFVALGKQLGDESAASIISQVAAGLTALFALVQGILAWRNRTWLAFPQAAFNILMFYLLLTCLWFQSWYAVWPLGIAALLPPGHAARLGALFGYAVLSKPLIFGPMWLWIRPLPSQFWREIRLGPAVLALPWLYTLFAIWHARHERRVKEKRKGQVEHNSTLGGGVGRPQQPNALIVVAKRPAAGQTKTRLTPPLSAEHAAELYECFLRDTLELIRQVPDVHPVVAYSPNEAKAYFADLAPDFELILQEGNGLGARLDSALTAYLRRGYARVVIMNSDSPTLPPSCLDAAFEALAGEADVVLGPCDDGGYYMIGLKHPAPRLLCEVRMSTPNVTTDTLSLAAEEGLDVELLPVWYDVDNAASLARLVQDLVGAPAGVARHTRTFLQRHRELL